MSLDEALHDDKQADLEIARHLAELAGPIALSYFRGDNRTWSKADGSPVSAADVAVDRAIRDELGRLRPEDGILTEEGEEVGAGQRRRWIIDPIDGTREFVAGRGDWGTNVALEVNGVITVGLMTWRSSRTATSSPPRCTSRADTPSASAACRRGRTWSPPARASA